MTAKGIDGDTDGTSTPARQRDVVHTMPHPMPHTTAGTTHEPTTTIPAETPTQLFTARCRSRCRTRRGRRRTKLTVAGVSLAATTARLERHWSREERRRPPWRRWAATHPALAITPDEIRARLAERERTVSGPVLAPLVELAGAGDHQAALLVTLVLLPRMVRAEAQSSRDRGGDCYEQLAGLLWEAVVTASNPGVATLRESIERNVWRRKWRGERPVCAVELDVDRAGPAAASGDHANDVVAAHHLAAVLSRLEAEGAITAATRRVLDQLAAGTDDPVGADRSAGAARKQRWRTIARARANPAVIEALTA
jgi:hypothetical protein